MEHIVYLAAKEFEADRLDYVVIRSQVERRVDSRNITTRTHHDEGNIHEVGVVSELEEKIEAAHTIHQVVADDKLSSVPLELLQSLSPICRLDDIFEAHLAKHIAKDRSGPRDIINN